MVKPAAEALEQGLESHVITYVEGELRGLIARKHHLDWLKRCIASGRSGAQVSDLRVSSGRISDPTLGRVLAIEQDETIQLLEAKVRRVEQAIGLLTQVEQQIITALYVERHLTVSGLALTLGYSEGHIRRVKRQALWQLAVAMGVVA